MKHLGSSQSNTKNESSLKVIYKKSHSTRTSPSPARVVHSIKVDESEAEKSPKANEKVMDKHSPPKIDLEDSEPSSSPPSLPQSPKKFSPNSPLQHSTTSPPTSSIPSPILNTSVDTSPTEVTKSAINDNTFTISQLENDDAMSSTSQTYQDVVQDLHMRLSQFQRTTRTIRSNVIQDDQFELLLHNVTEFQSKLENLTKSLPLSIAQRQTSSSIKEQEEPIKQDSEPPIEKDVDLMTGSETDTEVTSSNQYVPTLLLNLNDITPSKKNALASHYLSAIKSSQKNPKPKPIDIDVIVSPTKKLLFDIDHHHDENQDVAFKTPTKSTTVYHYKAHQTPLNLSNISMTPTKTVLVLNMLKTGHVFFLHSTSGTYKKKPMHVFLSNDGCSLCMVPANDKKRHLDQIKYKFDIDDVLYVQRGSAVKNRRSLQIKNSIGGAILGVRKGEAKVDPEIMFSIVTRERSIDLEASSKSECITWAGAWETVVATPTVNSTIN
ncbi:hypothetical protein AKO1_007009 [Acrasis kona]|uniref:PH domain-containing protein n=1 Tax=Acrasis kona TaxID=1008807 RepID=A0AAW2YU88_9EUKA